MKGPLQGLEEAPYVQAVDERMVYLDRHRKRATIAALDKTPKDDLRHRLGRPMISGVAHRAKVNPGDH